MNRSHCWIQAFSAGVRVVHQKSALNIEASGVALRETEEIRVDLLPQIPRRAHLESLLIAFLWPVHTRLGATDTANPSWNPPVVVPKEILMK